MLFRSDSRASSLDAAKTQEAAAAQQARAARAGAGASKSNASDEVNLSSLASALQGALSESPERNAHIERLASEYASGSYKADAQGTAKGIIGDAFLDSSEDKKPDKA